MNSYRTTILVQLFVDFIEGPIFHAGTMSNRNALIHTPIETLGNLEKGSLNDTGKNMWRRRADESLLGTEATGGMNIC